MSTWFTGLFRPKAAPAPTTKKSWDDSRRERELVRLYGEEGLLELNRESDEANRLAADGATKLWRLAIFAEPRNSQMVDIPVGSKVSIIEKEYTGHNSVWRGTYSKDDTKFKHGTLINVSKHYGEIYNYTVKLDTGEEITIDPDSTSPNEKIYYFKPLPNPLGGGKKSRRKRNSKKSRKNRRKSNRRR